MEEEKEEIVEEIEEVERIGFCFDRLGLSYIFCFSTFYVYHLTRYLSRPTGIPYVRIFDMILSKIIGNPLILEDFAYLVKWSDG